MATTNGNSKHVDIAALLGARDRARAAFSTQGDRVRQLKKSGAAKVEIDQEVAELKRLKEILTAAEGDVEFAKPSYTKCRAQLENLAKRRSIYFPAYEIYGGAAGLFDWGPPGCSIKAEVEALWRRHFVLEEDMLEISGPCLTPHVVLKTSGHVDRFSDLLVRDEKTGECYRADKLLEDWIEGLLAKETLQEKIDALSLKHRQAGAMNAEEISANFKELAVVSPDGNPLSYPYPFNLMFHTKIGPKEEASGTQGVGHAYLRPETAQGIFVNFRRLLEYNGGRMPFASAQLGLGFRNEIAPRNALLRVREFQMAEIEHFVHPDEKGHAKFDDVKSLCLPLFPRDKQLSDGQMVRNMSLKEAVEKKVIDNQTLAYFMARTYMFLRACGIQEVGLRFRQHLDTEMAHYASDCWDAEIETSYGWVECVGHADRSAFDLTHHSKVSKVDLQAAKKLEEPRVMDVVKCVLNKGLLGPTFKKDQARVAEALEGLGDAEKLAVEAELAANGKYDLNIEGKAFNITRAMVSFESTKERITEESYVPAVIEPSFGIGRIIYCILEHSFQSRGIEDQEERCFLALPPVIAPVKCSLLSISGSSDFRKKLTELKKMLNKSGVFPKIDDSTATIGKRYARTDEIGIPFGVTVDFQTLQDQTVTLRERDSMEQVRLPESDLASALLDLINGTVSWKETKGKFPVFVEQEVRA